MLSNVLGRRIVLLDRHRKMCFGRGRVVHKYKSGMSGVHQIAQQSVMGILAAQDPASAMEVHHDRQKPLAALWTIDAYRHLSPGSDRQSSFYYISG